MKFTVTCISLAMTLLAATSIQAVPILGSNGNGVAELNSESVAVPAGQVLVDSDQVKVGGVGGGNTGVDKTLSDVTQGTLGQKTTLRKRVELVDNLVGSKAATGGSNSEAVSKLVGGGGTTDNLAGTGGVVNNLAGDLLNKRSPAGELLGGQQGSGDTTNLLEGTMDAVLGTNAAAGDMLKRSSQNSVQKREGGFQEPGTYGSGMAANRPGFL